HLPVLPERIDAVVVDDDLGAAATPPSRDAVFGALGAAGFDVRRVTSVDELVTDEVEAPSPAPILLLLFGDVLPGKERAGYSPDALAAVARAVVLAREARRTIVVAQFSHPRLAAAIPAAPIVVSAWGG